MSENVETPASAEWLPAWSRAEGAGRARAAFEDYFGTEPDGVWSAPGRINLIGEHVDYNGGLCMPMALPHRTFVAFSRRDDDRVRLVSAQEPGAPAWTASLDEVGPVGTDGAVSGWGAYVAGVAWALREAGHAVTGFDAAVDSCVPYGAGLSSSAALEASVAVALDDQLRLGLGGDDDGRAELAALCIRAENEIAGALTGGMDQTAVLRCREGQALELDCRDGSVRQIPFGSESRAAAGGAPDDLHALEILVIDTRAPHQLVDGQYAERRTTCERAAQELGVATLREIAPADLADALAGLGDDVTRRRVRHVVTEIERTREVARLLDAGLVSEIGPVLVAGHASLRDDYEVSCPELDVAVASALRAGALGARMVGGGFGGSAIALVHADRAEAVAQAVVGAYVEHDFRAPAFLLAVPSAPAGRD